MQIHAWYKHLCVCVCVYERERESNKKKRQGWSCSLIRTEAWHNETGIALSRCSVAHSFILKQSNFRWSDKFSSFWKLVIELHMWPESSQLMICPATTYNTISNDNHHKSEAPFISRVCILFSWKYKIPQVLSHDKNFWFSFLERHFQKFVCYNYNITFTKL